MLCLEIVKNHRDLALFNLAIDSKLRGSDLVKLKVADVYAAGQVKERASIIQSKTQRPVRFEITEGKVAAATNRRNRGPGRYARRGLPVTDRP
ncbi:Phage integrase family protein (plasmid) [Rhodovulum sp. P5]|nr:Phage integrase family protein [Rhodovulum sp. P5]